MLLFHSDLFSYTYFTSGLVMLAFLVAVGSGLMTIDAASILSPGRPKVSVPVLTTSSAKYREQFLCVYAGDRKFVVNIHPQGDGQSWRGDVDGYAITHVRSPIASADPAWELVGRSLAQFNLPQGSVHSKYRALLMQGEKSLSAARSGGNVS